MRAEHAVRRRIGRWLVPLVLSGGSLLGALFLADWIVDHWNLQFEPARSPQYDRVLRRREFSVRVVTNALGFREPRLPAPKPQGTIRIVALGDSFTLGYGVEEWEAYPRRLEALLRTRDPTRRYEVINLGVGGTNPLDYLGHLREVGLAYEPDMVLIGLFAHDVSELRGRREVTSEPCTSVLAKLQSEIAGHRPFWKRLPQRLWPALYDLAGTRLPRVKRRLWGGDPGRGTGTDANQRSVRTAIVPAERWREVLLELADRYNRRPEVEAALVNMSGETKARLRPLITGEWDYQSALDWAPLWTLSGLLQPDVPVDSVLLPPTYDRAWRETIDTLRRIDLLARHAGARTVIAFVPAANQVSAAAWPFLETYGFRRDPRTLTDTTFVDRLRAFGAEAGIPVVDLLAPFRARSGRLLYFPEDGHWTAEGHELAATVLAEAILSR